MTDTPVAQLTTTLNPVLLAFIAGCCTWASTGIGSAIVLFGGPNGFPSYVMDLLFGASAGVMLAASFFSLLGPSVEYSKELRYAWFPPLFGFLTGVAFIKLVDCFMPAGADPHHHSAPGSRSTSPKQGRSPKRDSSDGAFDASSGGIEVDASSSSTPNSPSVDLDEVGSEFEQPKTSLTSSGHQMRHWTKKRVWLLVIAVTLHNIPEGIVLGVSYGSIVGEDSTNKNGPSLKDAILLTVALALQNIPEGLAVSIPLKKSGMTKMRSLCLGQLSGAVEVLGAIVGAGFVLLVTSLLPYALSFAAGCMIFVTVTELLPQSQMNDSKWGTIGVMAGFVLMMTLDTGFG